MGVPVSSSMEVVRYGALEDGTPLYCDKNAWEADGFLRKDIWDQTRPEPFNSDTCPESEEF